MRDLSDRATRGLVTQLARDVAGRYRDAGLFAFFFARGKLNGDPLFATLLAHGTIPDAERLVDLGCGQGLLHGWLSAARTRHDASPSTWPSHWPAPPRVLAYRGVDRSTRDVERARRAIAPDAVAIADLATIDADAIGPCDVVTLFDVLHYLGPTQQERLLGLVARSLAPGATLVLRVGDIAARDAARRSFAIDSVVATLRGHPGRLHRRTLPEWLALLAGLGFATEIIDPPDPAHGAATGLANVLVRARLHARDAQALK